MTEVFPPHSSWFVQFREPGDEDWITWSPTHERPKAVKRKKEIEEKHPEFRVRLVKETVSYTLDEEE